MTHDPDLIADLEPFAEPWVTFVAPDGELSIGTRTTTEIVTAILDRLASLGWTAPRPPSGRPDPSNCPHYFPTWEAPADDPACGGCGTSLSAVYPLRTTP